jgi:hypothetical protein
MVENGRIYKSWIITTVMFCALAPCLIAGVAARDGLGGAH